MREEDLEALRRGYEAWNRGDLGAVLALVDPDIEWRPGEEAPETWSKSETTSSSWYASAGAGTEAGSSSTSRPSTSGRSATARRSHGRRFATATML